MTPSPRIGRLNCLAGVRAELARIYRAARYGDIEWQTATKAAHILQILARLIEGKDIEDRLDILEERHSQGR